MKKLLAIIMLLAIIVNLGSCTLPIKSNTKDGTKDIPVSKITLDTTNIKGHIGDKYMLAASTVPDDATDPTVTWSSDSPKVASVSNLGLVELKALGETIITATTANGKTAHCYVTVEENMDDYKLVETKLNSYNYDSYIKIETKLVDKNIEITIIPLQDNLTYSDINIELEFYISEFYYMPSEAWYRREATLNCGIGKYKIPVTGVNNNFSKSIISISGIVSEYVEK